MSIIHKYILRVMLRNLCICLLTTTTLFLIIDFFDRVDDIIPEDVPVTLVIQYFLYKIPLNLVLMLPVSMLIASMLTIGLLSRDSEITAMRAAGMKILWITRPIYVIGLVLCVLSYLMHETIVPHSTRRGKEIYNIDIKRKHEKGTYSQNDFWWRSGNYFYSANTFDSRTNTIFNLSRFEINEDFRITNRLDAKNADWVDAGIDLGWSMHDVVEYDIAGIEVTKPKRLRGLPLLIREKPSDFYDRRTETHTMNYSQLRRFIRQQTANGVSVSGYMADLYDKISFHLINLIIAFVVIPFALQPARSGSMASSLLSGLIIGFAYYAVHSFSLSMGRAELWPAMLSAWVANLLMTFIGIVLNLGAEAP